MKKIVFSLVLIVLVFSCPSIQAEMSMRIISRNMRSHDEKAVADNKEKKEATKAVEIEEVAGETEVTDASEVTETVAVEEVVEASEATEAAGVKEATEVTDAAMAAEVTETSEVTEATEAVEAAKVEVAKEEVEVTEARTAVEATETSEVTEAAGVDGVAGTTEVIEVIEVAEVTAVVEAAEAVEATQAKMPMRIISRYKRLYEEKVVADNGEKKEATKSAVVEETEGDVEVTEATTAVEATEAKMSMRKITRNIRSYNEKVAGDNEENKEATKVAGVDEVAEPTEAKETKEVTEKTEAGEVGGTTKVAEIEEAAKVTETVEVIGPVNVGEVKEEVEVAEITKAVDATEISEVTETDIDAVAGTTEIKEESVGVTETTVAVGATEAKEVVGSMEVTETAEVIEAATVEGVKEAVKVTEATEATRPVEVAEVIVPTDTIEAEPVDYEALGLSSVELNPNDYPDEVIALLESHKNNENNNSVLFYSSLGLAYKSKGRLKAAIAAYKRALKLVPNVPAPSIQYNLGIAYYYNNELHKSFNCFLNCSAQRSNHIGTEKWIKQIADELNIYGVPNTSKLKLVVNQKISVNRKKDDRESRIRIYLTQNGGRIQELSVKDKIYAYGIDSDTVRPVDYVIIDNDGDGSFDNVINTKGKFGVPTWAYNPD